MDAESIKRILSKVTAPADLDRKIFLNDLRSIQTRHLFRRQIPTPELLKKRELAATIKLARKLKNRLPGLPSHQGAIDLVIKDLERIRATLEEIDRMKARTRQLKRPIAQPAPQPPQPPASLIPGLFGAPGGMLQSAPEPAPPPADLSAFEELAGVDLREIWKKHFGRKAGYTRDPLNESIEGEYIDFAEVVLSEMGVTNSDAPYSRRSIADALTKGRFNPEAQNFFPRLPG
jgi:hypothetical protein